MADEEIKTSIDALVAYLREHGETGITTLSSSLGVGESTIIEWSNILEQANMVKITYKAGKMYLSPLSLTRESVDVMKRADASQLSSLNTETSSQLAQVSQISLKIDSFEKLLTEAETLFKTRYKDLKSMLDRVSGIESAMNASYKAIMQKKADAEAAQAKLQNQLDSIQKYAKDLEKFSLDTNSAKAVVQDIKSKIDLYNKSTATLGKNIDELVNQHKSNSANLSNSIHEEINELGEIVKEEERQISEYERVAKSYQREARTMKERVSNGRSRIIDDIAKNKQEVDRFTSGAEREVSELRNKLGEVKKGFGEAAGFNDRIVQIKSDLLQIKKEKDTLAKELSALANEIKSLQGTTTARILEKREKIEKATKKSKKVHDRLGRLRELAGKAEKDITEMGST